MALLLACVADLFPTHLPDIESGPRDMSSVFLLRKNNQQSCKTARVQPRLGRVFLLDDMALACSHAAHTNNVDLRCGTLKWQTYGVVCVALCAMSYRCFGEQAHMRTAWRLQRTGDFEIFGRLQP